MNELIENLWWCSRAPESSWKWRRSIIRTHAEDERAVPGIKYPARNLKTLVLHNTWKEWIAFNIIQDEGNVKKWPKSNTLIKEESISLRLNPLLGTEFWHLLPARMLIPSRRTQWYKSMRMQSEILSISKMRFQLCRFGVNLLEKHFEFDTLVFVRQS